MKLCSKEHERLKTKTTDPCVASVMQVEGHYKSVRTCGGRVRVRESPECTGPVGVGSVRPSGTAGTTVVHWQIALNTLGTSVR